MNSEWLGSAQHFRVCSEKNLAEGSETAVNVAWMRKRAVPNSFRKPPVTCRFSPVGLLQDYSKYDVVGLRPLIERIESTPKRASTSTNTVPVERRLHRRLSPDTIAELVAAYQSGTSTNELCRRFNVSKGGALRLLAEHGVPMRQQPMTEDEIDRAVQLHHRWPVDPRHRRPTGQEQGQCVEGTVASPRY